MKIYRISLESDSEGFNSPFVIFRCNFDTIAEIADELAEVGMVVGEQLFTRRAGTGRDGHPIYEIERAQEVAIGKGSIKMIRQVADAHYREAA